MKKILITGASGFIGSFIVAEALNRGYEVWAAMRGSSSKQFLTDERIHFIQLNLDDEQQLEEALRPYRFDVVVHAAGVTKCLKVKDFHRINTLGTQHLVEVLRRLNMPLHRFVYLSSLSVYGAIHEKQPYTEIREEDEPKPNTAYGKSKLEAERYLESLTDFPYVILRPTGATTYLLSATKRLRFSMMKITRMESSMAPKAERATTTQRTGKAFLSAGKGSVTMLE